MFLPCTITEIKKAGWVQPDIILVSGDAYIDTPYSGIAVIGRVLASAGFKVAIIPQPDINSLTDISKFGEPRLFWGLSGGCVDSMVANRTATNKRRQADDFTPGGINNARPDRAVITYCNLIRSAFKPCKPLVIGGIEASLRRIAHYDFWSNRVRRPLLFDARADILIYGMGERTIVALANAMQKQEEWRTLPGICFLNACAEDQLPANSLQLPSFDSVSAKTPDGYAAFIEMFKIFAANQHSSANNTLVQLVDNRYLIHNPPAPMLTTMELDKVYELPYTYEAHPMYKTQGKIRALDTIRFSVTTHRGCYGECNFCAIAMHQGRSITSRSEQSILREVRTLTQHPQFKGNIYDVGGPTANMYNSDCPILTKTGGCINRRCLFPKLCKNLQPGHHAQIALLRKIRALPGVNKVFVTSGIRPDLAVGDLKDGIAYVQEITAHHVSGQLKVAPEHSVPHVLSAMGKPDIKPMLTFKHEFEKTSRATGKKQFLTYYMIAAHPGCSDADMQALRSFAISQLQLVPEQVQIFTPTPSTWSTLMYYTGVDPFTNQRIHVTTDTGQKQRQKDIMQHSLSQQDRNKGAVRLRRGKIEITGKPRGKKHV